MFIPDPQHWIGTDWRERGDEGRKGEGGGGCLLVKFELCCDFRFAVHGDTPLARRRNAPPAPLATTTDPGGDLPAEDPETGSEVSKREPEQPETGTRSPKLEPEMDAEN
jgi:hypothetical protein